MYAFSMFHLPSFQYNHITKKQKVDNHKIKKNISASHKHIQLSETCATFYTQNSTLRMTKKKKENIQLTHFWNSCNIRNILKN